MLAMKYMLIIYGNRELWGSLTRQEWEETVARFDAFNQKFFATGELLGGYGVADPDQARIVRVRDGVPAVTDGPYLETKEYLASWWLLDVADERRALEIAAEIPSASLREVEMWPILHEAQAGR
jgi:hypothetical protein